MPLIRLALYPGSRERGKKGAGSDAPHVYTYVYAYTYAYSVCTVCTQVSSQAQACMDVGRSILYTQEKVGRSSVALMPTYLHVVKMAMITCIREHVYQALSSRPS